MFLCFFHVRNKQLITTRNRFASVHMFCGETSCIPTKHHMLVLLWMQLLCASFTSLHKSIHPQQLLLWPKSMS